MIKITNDFVRNMDGAAHVAKTVEYLFSKDEQPMTVGDGIDCLIASVHTADTMEELKAHLNYAIGQLQIYKVNVEEIEAGTIRRESFL